MKSNHGLLRYSCLTVLISLVSAVLFGCGVLPKEEGKLAPPLIKPAEEKYDLYKVVKKDIVNEIDGTGNLVSANDISVSFKKQGLKLGSINVKAGDAVKKGQTLAAADGGDLDNQISIQEIEVQKKQINLQYLQDQYAEYQGDPSKMPNADAKTMQRDIQIQQLDLQEANLQLSEMKKQEADSTLTAPMDGVVTYVADLKQGDSLTPYSAVVTISDQKVLTAYFKSDTLVDVKTGMAAKVTYAGKDYDCKVVMAPDSTPPDQSDKYKNAVLINVPNLPSDAKIGDTVSIKIPMQSKSGVIVIPKTAITSSAGNSKVQVMEGNVKKDVNVQVGLQNSTEAEIISGLQEGQMVILR